MNLLEKFGAVKIEKRDLHEDIVQKLQDMIQAKELSAGTRLPTEREMADLFKVSRATLREAIGVMEQRGLIGKKVGVGTFVKNISNSIVEDTLERFLIFGDCSFEELMEIRNCLEPQAASLAAKKADAGDLENLKKCVINIENVWESRGSIKVYAAADADFHKMLACATHNKLISAFMSAIQSFLEKWIEIWSNKKWQEMDVRAHREIYDAIADSNPENARKLMQAHLDRAYLQIKHVKKVKVRSY